MTSILTWLLTSKYQSV